jgi:FkbM family methyltransferase
LEELGIPGVSIVQEGFVSDAKATGEAYSLPNPPLAVTPFVFTSLNAPQTRQAVDAIIDQIVQGLTEPLPPIRESIVERMTTRGPKDDVLEFNVDPKNTAANSFVIQRGGSYKVRLPLTTIDKLAADLKLERIDFIKMDIEGAEPNAVRGAAESIRKWKPRLALSTYHAPHHPRLIPSLVWELRTDYTVACGPCAVGERVIRPDVMYFY